MTKNIVKNPLESQHKLSKISKMKTYYVYIMTNQSGTLYIGVTNNLARRLYEHTKKLNKGFTHKYNINKLIYFESTHEIQGAIQREKQLKGLKRNKKLALIRTLNPHFEDLGKKLFNHHLKQTSPPL